MYLLLVWFLSITLYTRIYRHLGWFFKFQISDISRFQQRFQNFWRTVQDFRVVSNPSPAYITGIRQKIYFCIRVHRVSCTYMSEFFRGVQGRNPPSPLKMILPPWGRSWSMIISVVNIIVANHPRTPRTVPDLEALSQIPKFIWIVPDFQGSSDRSGLSSFIYRRPLCFSKCAAMT